MVQKMRVKTSYDGNKYITPGKVYGTFEWKVFPNGHSIRDDAGQPRYILLDRPCAHLGSEGMWEVVEWGEPV